ncbi:MAG: metallophosphoesterase [Bacteroidales bacterium]|nr:metallophosphoesterase [Bacteroidales bacterium]
MTEKHRLLKRILPYATAAVISLLLFAVSMYFTMPALMRRTKMYAILFMADIYLWLRLNNLFSSKFKSNKVAYITFTICYWAPYFLLMGLTIFQLVKGTSYINDPDFYNWKGVCTMIYLFKFVVALLLLLFDIVILIRRKKNHDYQPAVARHIPAIFGVLCLLFTGFAIWGMTYAAHHFIVRHVDIRTSNNIFKNKPLRVVQISDIHLGTWRNPQTVQQIVNLVNEQHGDMVVFTGDMVQSSSKEMLPYLEVLAQVKAPLGVYSILGNHDYGTYSDLRTDEARKADMTKLEQYHHQMGWQLLRNESIRAPWNGDSLTLAGIEFWCDKPMNINTGDPKKTFLHVSDSDYVIFLCHSPEMWDEITGQPWPANLTLCGHTHGMQAGVLSERLRFSPSILMFRQWGGLYKNSRNSKQQMYVNPGLAATGMPARFGMYPEVTVLTINN